MNPLVELQSYGQSFWYDNIRRKFLIDGTIERLIVEDGLRGMTSNPSIFDKAIGLSDDYDDQLSDMASGALSVKDVYERVAIFDIRVACDMFKKLYSSSNGGDGYVSLEVSPHLAHNTSDTIEEALRLFATVDRPNLMIKVPATKEGIPAIKELLSRGININVTLMFSMEHYLSVASAYIAGLDNWLANKGKPEKVSSVASFFVSRVDSDVDEQLSGIGDPAAELLKGKSAVANSKLVYQKFKELFYGKGFDKLAKTGARRQRLLWASTSTKNRAYPDTMYVDELIGSETVNTMPPQTIDAFRDHGRVSNSLEEDVDEAKSLLENVEELGLDLDEITNQLQIKGVKAFADSFDQLMLTLETKLSKS
jgi:transaldolase